MKKGKFMLAAVAVVGIVGATLAFTAKKAISGSELYSYSDGKCVDADQQGFYTPTATTPGETITWSLKATSGVTTCTELVTTIESND